MHDFEKTRVCPSLQAPMHSGKCQWNLLLINKKMTGCWSLFPVLRYMPSLSFPHRLEWCWPIWIQWSFVTVCTQYILFSHQLHNHMNRQLRGFIKSQYTCIGFGAFTLFTLSILFHIYSCLIHSSTPTPFPLSISHQLASLFPFSSLSPSLLYPTSLLAHSLPLLLLFPPSLFLPFSLSLSPPPSFSGHSVWESSAEIVRSRRSRRRWDWDTMIMTCIRHHPLYATR